MKKLIAVLLTLCFLAICCIYIFIPRTLTISSVQTAACTPNELGKVLHSHPAKWLPDHASALAGGFHYNALDFHEAEPLLDGSRYLISDEGQRFNSLLQTVAHTGDSTFITWKTVIDAGMNPIHRYHAFKNALHIKAAMDQLLQHLSSFAGKADNIYGFNIQRGGFNDSLLIATKETLSHYPATEDIYRLVRNLKAYVLQRQARETDAPMYHVIEEDSMHYRLMVAQPIDHIIPEEAGYFILRMVVKNGRYVQTVVHGGPETLKQAHRQIENFMTEHQLTAPAIPFEIMVTDRMKETDTAKWVTKVYHPST